MDYRIFVEKKPGFQVEAEQLKHELNENLQLNMRYLRIINVYDLFGFSESLLEKARYSVLGERVTDDVTMSFESANYRVLAIESLPGQFDQRAASAVDCVRLIEPSAEVEIKSGKLILVDSSISEQDFESIKTYCINKVESREKDMSSLLRSERAQVMPLESLRGFTMLVPNGSVMTPAVREALEKYREEKGLVMEVNDLYEVVRYFQHKHRDPNFTELKILDTYWSDHCRHTTFTTILENIKIEESFVSSDISDTYHLYLDLRKHLKRANRPIFLMDLATIGMRYLRQQGKLDDLEQSEENNACSIHIDVDSDGVVEPWLLMFKNETHNHPTEIEPFGGAATCLGGAIRDPLSGRSYVYQAMRVTGAGDVTQSIAETIKGKLPQKQIARQSAHGYSSYGNQIGLATTFVREIYHPGYAAKRMEVGAVVGAVKTKHVRRETPADGDVILLLGGRTGRDGIGGATGSSKQHTEKSKDICGSEVQKGNAPEERKLQRLFRIPQVTRMIKKSNDFGAGGVCVAIGELADGLDIYLDRIPTKYDGLNMSELAISESQERMAVVIESESMEEFHEYCKQENVEVTHVADVTSLDKMRMYYKNHQIVDLDRSFINSAGAKHYADVCIGKVEEESMFSNYRVEGTLHHNFEQLMQDINVASQQGLSEMFDATIGRSTVLMPYGGKMQKTPQQSSIQKLPTEGFTHTASVMAYGFDPYLSEWSPYHGAAYAVIDACTKIVAAGADYRTIRFSFQEYFERMTEDPHTWGKPFAALLGALKMQVELQLPAIGGKDSMSGSFEQLHVPPTLIAFGITTINTHHVISSELKSKDHLIYILPHHALKNGMPNTKELKANWTALHELIEEGKIKATYAVGRGGIAEAICKMSFGNQLGVDIDLSPEELFRPQWGTLVIEASEPLDHSSFVGIGRVVQYPDYSMKINGERIDLAHLLQLNEQVLSSVYPLTSPQHQEETMSIPHLSPVQKTTFAAYKGKPISHPLVYIPVFPGTNCEYDTVKAFRKAGAKVVVEVFRTLTEEDIKQSIERMKLHLSIAQIFMLPGGFSAGDEPDGSGKFIACILQHEEVAHEIHELLKRQGLILGICNGFQALIKSGLLPYGRVGQVAETAPTLFHNNIHRHISRIVTTRLVTDESPWLKGLDTNRDYGVAVSHGEGKLVVSEAEAQRLFANGQVAFQYVHPSTHQPTMQEPFNPNGSSYAIEGLLSPGGQILGKMGHSERYEEGLYQNIYEQMDIALFENAVNYFRNK